MKKITPDIFIFLLITVLLISCTNIQKTETYPEPADPDTYDMSVWENIESGIHSGFGSLDVAYSRSIPPSGNITESTQIQGWKGERISCLLLFWSNGNEETILLKANGFSNNDSKISKESISISVVKYVLVDQFLNEKSGSCGPRDNDKTPVHIKPDLLSDETSFTFKTAGTRPVWISVDIPDDTPAGTYEGSITSKSESGTVDHMITLEVLDKVLPDPSDWSFHLDLWQNPFAVARFHGVELWSRDHFKLLKPLLEKLADAGQKCITATLVVQPWGGGACFDPFGSMINWTKKKDGTWAYNYFIFDKYVSFAMECGINKQINCYSMVPITNEFSWFDEETSETLRMEAKPGTEKYENFWRGFLLDFRTHLKGKGWLEITALALDEREQEEMKANFKFLEETAPEFKISMAGFYYEDINSSLYEFSSNWRDYGRIPEDAIKTRKKAGQITTYYVACGIPKPNNFTFSPQAESCFEGWLASAMGFDGFLRWAYNSWPENPLLDSRYTKWPSGDTYFVYPDAQSSVRFERLREGIQDYEKIRILREELSGKSSEEALAELKRLNDFLATVDAGTIYKRSAAEVINQGKQLIYEIVKY